MTQFKVMRELNGITEQLTTDLSLFEAREAIRDVAFNSGYLLAGDMDTGYFFRETDSVGHERKIGRVWFDVDSACPSAYDILNGAECPEVKRGSRNAANNYRGIPLTSDPEPDPREDLDDPDYHAPRAYRWDSL